MIEFIKPHDMLCSALLDIASGKLIGQAFLFIKIN